MTTDEARRATWAELLAAEDRESAWAEVGTRLHRLASQVLAAWGRTWFGVEDLVAECEYRLFAKLSSVLHGLSCCASAEQQDKYLAVFARNTLTDLWRKDIRRRAAEARACPQASDRSSPAPTAQPPEDRVLELIQSLPEPSRSLLQLRFVEHLSLAETATTLGISYAAAASRIHRALGELRRLMTPQRFRPE